MKQKRPKKLFIYSAVVFLILMLSAIVLLQVVTNIYVLFSVLVIVYIIFVLMLFHFFDKYIKPIEKASEIMDKLLQGNYHARINREMNGTIGELSTKINSLARNLSELTIQEQIQAEQLSTIIENSESGLVLIDEKGYIHVVNRKFLSMFGKSVKEYIGHIYYDVIDNEQIHHTVQETFLYEKRVKQLFSTIQDDEKVYLEIVGAPIFNERNMLRGAVLVIYDITEFKNVEVMRKDFVANVSHELKTPITSIKGFAETLLDGALQDPETSKQFMKIIYDESNRIQSLIDDLLILSRLEKDELDVDFGPIHVGTLIDDILPIIYQAAKQKDIDIVVDVKQEIEFTADEEKIKQILINLLTNAISYTSDKGKVTLGIEEKNNEVEIEVKDSGIGISKLALPRIFERFYRVDKDRSRDTGGTGLGLAIVKHIVEVHQGEIHVESELDKGTSFKINLPKEQHIP